MHADPQSLREPRSRAASIGAVLLSLAVILVAVGAYRWWPRTVDDAYITFRYADNLVRGEGPVFNPGERVEGYSSPVWMILAAASIAAGLDPVLPSKILGLVASVLLVLLLRRELSVLGVDPLGTGLAVLTLGSSLVLQIWSVAGMETNAYAFLWFAGLSGLACRELRPPTVLSASVLLAMAALTRPEGLAFWILGFAIPLGWGRASRRRLAAYYAAPGAAIAAYVAWRFAYYGVGFPNTYYAKTGGGVAMWQQGLRGLELFAFRPAHAGWILAALLGTAWGFRLGRRRAATVFATAVLLHLLWVVSVGDDGLRVHRFYVPILAPLALSSGMLFLPSTRGKPARGLAWIGGALMICTVVASLWTLHLRMVPTMRASLVYQHGNVKLGRYLRDHPPGDWIAVAAAGAVPFYSRAPTIDMYGLNDTHIARVPFPGRRRGRMMKWDTEYVLSRRPRLIVINRGYFRAEDPEFLRAARDPGRLAVSDMDRDLFRRIGPNGDYRLRVIPFDDGSKFFVFERSEARP